MRSIRHPKIEEGESWSSKQSLLELVRHLLIITPGTNISAPQPLHSLPIWFWAGYFYIAWGARRMFEVLFTWQMQHSSCFTNDPEFRAQVTLINKINNICQPLNIFFSHIPNGSTRWTKSLMGKPNKHNLINISKICNFKKDRFTRTIDKILQAKLINNSLPTSFPQNGHIEWPIPRPWKKQPRKVKQIQETKRNNVI